MWYLKHALFIMFFVFSLICSVFPNHMSVSPCWGATFTVNSTKDMSDANPKDGKCRTAQGDCTLRAAIEQTNYLPGQDTIRLGHGQFEAKYELSVTDTLVIEGQGLENTIIAGKGAGNIFLATRQIDKDIALTVRYVKITKGYANYGAGVHNDGAKIILEHCALTDNTSDGTKDGMGGGGIYNDEGTVIIRDTLFSDNAAAGNGGAIYNNNGTMKIFDSLVMKNYSAAFGSVFSEGGSLLIRKSNIRSNRSLAGGGIFIVGDKNGRDNAMEESKVLLNEALIGGGVVLSKGKLVITNCDLLKNKAASYGGGILRIGGVVSLISTKVRNNSPENCSPASLCSGK